MHLAFFIFVYCYVGLNFPLFFLLRNIVGVSLHTFPAFSNLLFHNQAADTYRAFHARIRTSLIWLNLPMVVLGSSQFRLLPLLPLTQGWATLLALRATLETNWVSPGQYISYKLILRFLI